MRRVVAGVVLVLLVTNAVSAGPVETAKLISIADLLLRVERTLADINDAVTATKDRFAEVYPPSVLAEIKYVFGRARSIQRELEDLSCGWKFSPRMRRFWDGLFRGVRLCKSEWQLVFGPPPEYAFSDLEEYYDYTGTRRMNMVASRVQRGQEQEEFFAWLLQEAEAGRKPGNEKASPGYSQRLSAVGAAALGNVLLEQGDTMTALLELAQERASDRRLRQRMGTNAALALYAGLGEEGAAAAALPQGLR